MMGGVGERAIAELRKLFEPLGLEPFQGGGGTANDPHAPAQYRADTVRNLDPWYQAFNVQPGEKLYLTPAQRVRVW